MKNECSSGVDIEFKILMRKAKSLLKQTTPLQICSAPFFNSPEQSNFVNMDTEGAIESILINGVSILSRLNLDEV